MGPAALSVQSPPLASLIHRAAVPPNSQLIPGFQRELMAEIRSEHSNKDGPTNQPRCDSTLPLGVEGWFL